MYIRDIVLQNSMCAQKHIEQLDNYIHYINNEQINGSIVECGVWKGGLVLWMLHCQSKYSHDRDIFLYDTFEGMTEPSHMNDDEKAKEIYTNIVLKKEVPLYDKWHNENKWCYASLEYVKNIVNLANYNESKIKYIVGDVIDTLSYSKNIPDKIALIRLDTDWYESTKKELEILIEKVTIGGIVVIDDYYDWKGSRIATDEFMDKNPGVLVKIEGGSNPYTEGNVLILKKIKYI